MEKKHHHHHHKIDHSSIPEQEAIDRTRDWLHFIEKNIPGEKNAQIVPRAVYISMEDIKELYDKHKDDAIAVRAYFTYREVPVTVHHLHGEIKPEISVVLVAVNKDNTDMISHDKSLSAGNSNVYDFTKPCPDMCDPKSPLYTLA